MQIIAKRDSKRALRITVRVKKAEARDLDVEGMLRALLRADPEDVAIPEVCAGDDGEAVRRLHLVAEECSKDPPKPCRWFKEMPEFAHTSVSGTALSQGAL
jgi:hypothetical protein